MENTEGGKGCIKKQVKFKPLYQILGYIGNLQKMIQLCTCLRALVFQGKG